MGGRGSSSGKKSSGIEKIRGVLQTEIDKLRGTRDHQDRRTMYWQTIQEDYARVGIEITREEAIKIRKSINDFTYQDYTSMRKAKSKELKGEALSSSEQEALRRYKQIEEYCKIAPSLPSGQYTELYRGVGINAQTTEYTSKLLSLKAGDKWDIDRMPTSFTTKIDVAQNYAFGKETSGIVIHMPASKVRNAPSVKGMSEISEDFETIVADYSWKVSRVEDQRVPHEYGYYHIYLDK